MRAGVVAFVRSELPQQMNRPTRVAFRQGECSRKVILASQVDRLNKVSFASHVYRLDNGSRRNTETVNGNNRTTDLSPQSVLPSAVSVVLVDPVPPSGKR